MADASAPTNGSGIAPPANDPAAAGPQIRILAQFVKDLSFENPSALKMLSGPGTNPNLQVQVNVGATPAAGAGTDVYESAIDFKAHATNNSGVIYDLELVYAGVFKIENLPAQHLEPFLLVNCPTLLFPFLRRLVADLTREGGFPPLMLDPIDFGMLYLRRQQEMQAAGNTTPTAS